MKTRSLRAMKVGRLSLALGCFAAAAALGGCEFVAGLDLTLREENDDGGGALKDASLPPGDATIGSNDASIRDSTVDPPADARSGDDSSATDATMDSAPPSPTALWLLDPTFGDGGVMAIDVPQTSEALDDGMWLTATPDTIWLVGAAGDLDGDGNAIGTEIIGVPKSGGANSYHYSAVGPASGAVTVDATLYLTTTQVLNKDGGLATGGGGDDDDDINIHLYDTTDGVMLTPRGFFTSRDTGMTLLNLVPVGRAGRMRAVGYASSGAAYLELFGDGGSKLTKIGGVGYDEIAAGVESDGGTWLVGSCSSPPCTGIPNGALFVPDDGGHGTIVSDLEPGSATTIAAGPDGSLLLGGYGSMTGLFAPVPATDASTIPLAIDPPLLVPDPSNPDGFVAVTTYEVGVSESLIVLSLDHQGAETKGPLSITALPWSELITVAGAAGDGSTYLYVALTVDEEDGGVRWELVRLVANPAIAH